MDRDVAILTSLGGAVLVWAGLTGRRPLADVGEFLRSGDRPTGANRRTITGATLGTTAGSVAPTTGGQVSAGDQSEASWRPARVAGGSCRLTPDAAASLERVNRQVRVVVTSCGRSAAEQRRAYDAEQARNPGSRRFAPPGSSMHERGIAIDIHTGHMSEALHGALMAEGWRRFDARREPWHWSYRVVG